MSIIPGLPEGVHPIWARPPLRGEFFLIDYKTIMQCWQEGYVATQLIVEPLEGWRFVASRVNAWTFARGRIGSAWLAEKLQ